eukprot:Selendium_serpulae@DN6355_c0_g1_i7.p1
MTRTYVMHNVMVLICALTLVSAILNLSCTKSLWSSTHQKQPYAASASLHEEPHDVSAAVHMYYINMDASADRRQYMDSMFRAHFGDARQYRATRIRAVDSGNLDMVLNVTTRKQKRLEKTCNSLGTVGNTLSHFKSIAKAYEDGVGFALVFEDDASFEFVPHFPKPIKELVAEMDALDPDWDVIRFAYAVHPYRPILFKNFTATYKKSYPKIPNLKKWDLSKEHSGMLIGSVVQLYSRKALARIVARFVSLHGRAPSQEELERDPLSRYTFRLTVKKKYCQFDKLLAVLDLNTYVATPPYFTVRYAEGSTGLRSGTPSRFSDVLLMHLKF